MKTESVGVPTPTVIVPVKTGRMILPGTSCARRDRQTAILGRDARKERGLGRCVRDGRSSGESLPDDAASLRVHA